MRKIDDSTELEIFAKLQNGVSYSQIAEEYGIGKGTINRIKNRKDQKLEIDNPGTRTIAHRRKLKERAIERNIVKHSEIIVFEMIDVLGGLKYCVNNLMEINEDAKSQVGQITKKLDGLLGDVKNHIGPIELNNKGQDTGKDALVKQIYLVLSMIGNYYSKQKIRIDAINALKEQMKMFLDYEISAKALAGVKDFLENLFKALNILPDKEYKLVRDRLIELNPSSREFFSRYEETVDGSPEHNNEPKQQPV